VQACPDSAYLRWVKEMVDKKREVVGKWRDLKDLRYGMIYLYNFQMADSLVLRMLKEGELKDEGIVKHIANLIRTQVSDRSELKGLDNIE
jgi:hypothetical protein